jgi:hypothetical protein
MVTSEATLPDLIGFAGDAKVWPPQSSPGGTKVPGSFMPIAF